MEYLGAWGTLINEKTWSRKSRVRLPLSGSYTLSYDSLPISPHFYDQDKYKLCNSLNGGHWLLLFLLIYLYILLSGMGDL